MSRYYLVALSEVAKEFQQSNGGGPDFLLQESTKIGRNVARGEGYKVPLQWQQVSGQHCRIFFDSRDGKWYIEDTSTNGTYLNGERLKKAEKTEIKLGDTIKLSTQAISSKPGVPEYEFVKRSGQHQPSEMATDVSSAKRKQGGPDYTTSKRPRYFADGGSSVFTTGPDCTMDQQTSADNSLLKTLSQLQKSNEDLRVKLDASRSKHAETERQLKASETALSKTKEEKEEAVKCAESKAKRAAVQCENLESQLKASKSHCESLESNLEEAKATCASLSGEKKKFEEMATKYQTECEGFKSHCEDLKKDLEMSIAEKEGAKKTLVESRKRVSELVVKERQNASEKERLEEEKARLQNELNERIDAANASTKILGQTVLKVEKEFTSMKSELAEAKARCSQLEQDKASLEEIVANHRRVGDVAVEEAKGARDKMAMMQAFIENMAPFAKRIGAAANEMNEMAGELMSRFEAATAPACEDHSISETECGAHERVGSAQRKTVLVTPRTNRMAPIREAVILSSKQMSQAGKDGSAFKQQVENSGGAQPCETMEATRSPSQGTCEVDDMDVDLEGVGQGATSNKTLTNRLDTPSRMSKRHENDVMQVKQTLTLSNGMRVSQTLDVERDEEGSSMPENEGITSKTEIVEAVSVAEKALLTQPVPTSTNEASTQPSPTQPAILASAAPAPTEPTTATQSVGKSRSQSGDVIERCEGVGQGSSPCLDVYGFNSVDVETPGFGMDPTQETQALLIKNQPELPRTGGDPGETEKEGEFEGMD
ncbi:hypothetical protein BSKO_03858 [Bryopsis sp. KO-2023]|nr:hypothetical protein BSKO_03858 [Bryopsis sp. KO-2023]